jgi:hypothetical protein
MIIVEEDFMTKTSETKIPVYTADGMLTRASAYIPAGYRARKICIHMSTTNELRKITVSISPHVILTFTSPLVSITEGAENGLIQTHQIHGKNRGLKWHGWAWKITYTHEWKQDHVEISEQNAISALSIEHAIVEQLRFILNKELHIRPLVSDRVCVEVTNMLKKGVTNFFHKIALQGIRQKVSEMRMHE